MSAAAATGATEPFVRAASIDVAAMAQLACLLEASAPKPGNVSPGRRFSDVGYEHFVASAVAIRDAFARSGAQPLGVTIRQAVEATRRWTRSNTNLGMVLLLAPLARAAALANGSSLRAAVAVVLNETTIDDARETYAAIRLASPGGLGSAPSQDVADEPTATLRDVMTLAATRDGVAREYASSFATTFELGAPALQAARRQGLGWNEAIVQTFLTLLAASPDTHIARRAGMTTAELMSRDARAVLDAGGVTTPAGRQAIDHLDERLRADGNLASPGTSADLSAAAIFVVLLGGGWEAEVGDDHAASR